jgi:transposase-like protein
VTPKTLRKTITTKADRASYLMTDEAPVYRGIERKFSGHGAVNYSANQHVRTGGLHHPNTIESFFALIKRRVYGNFHHVSKAHLRRYLAEFDFRYNHRADSDSERAVERLRGAMGKWLLYRQPNPAESA